MPVISNCTPNAISVAAKALKEGNLVAFPTETVYGLGADATNITAVKRIYSVKARPIGHPVIVHISSINRLDKWSEEIPKYAIKLAEDFWPGPITLILRRSKLAKNFITGGQDNVGLRVPNHRVALELLESFEKLGGIGIAAPSANKFGAVSPTTAKAVFRELSSYLDLKDLILDGGKCSVGIESTIVDCTRNFPVILRPGAITTEMIQHSSNLKVMSRLKKISIKASGLLDSHYAPLAKVIESSDVEIGEGFIAMSTIDTPYGAIRLASPRCIQQYARDLYSAFRDADIQGITSIKIIPPDGPGLAEAIRDRIHKASSS
jgi:L-threonylcarbamoyladenylate synthase